jgi:hypothetical protein
VDEKLRAQRAAEMSRGREVAARHRALNAPEEDRLEREHTLRRFVAAEKLLLSHRDTGDVIAYCGGQEVAAERQGPAFPSEGFVARCALAVSAFEGLAGVPDYAPTDERRRRDEKRSHVHNWSKGNP